MQKVTQRAQNYFSYVPPHPDASLWGAAVTAAGFTRIPRGAAYPPGGHPGDRQFSWENGRALGTFQVVYILKGSGLFESRSAGVSEITAGTVFLLFPGEWHRYAPRPETGWVESWMEVEGECVRRLIRTGVFSPSQPVQAVREGAKLQALFRQLHGQFRASSPTFNAEVSTTSLAILALLQSSERDRSGPPSIVEQAVARAQALFTEPGAEALSMPKLARQLGVGYSHFRREFKACTGLSPKQYLDRMRLEKGRRLIGSTTMTLDAIAAELGYLSGFHFSAAFKREFGIAPAHWRRQHLL